MKKVSLKFSLFIAICLMTVFCMQLPVKAEPGVCQDRESSCLAGCGSSPTPACQSGCVDVFEACCAEVPQSKGCSPELE